MANDVLDWTFAEVPADDAPAGTALVVSKMRAPRPPARTWAWPKPRVPRWLWVIVPLGVLVAALGVTAQAVAQSGWRRIEQQVGEAVTYEDAQARSGQVNAVLAAQVHTDGGWLTERKLEVSYSQPAPNPAPQLHLLPDAPVVSSLTATYIDQVQATVVRSYADTAGNTYQFEWVQTYVSAQPGIWLRQPTETDATRTMTTWADARLAATFPVADQPWMRANLPLIEADLEIACADWHCPPGILAPLAFSNILPLAPSPAGQIVLLSPHLAGMPHDDKASQALRYGITARALVFMAGQMSGGEPSVREALLARAEGVLGKPQELEEALKAVAL